MKSSVKSSEGGSAGSGGIAFAAGAVTGICLVSIMIEAGGADTHRLEMIQATVTMTMSMSRTPEQTARIKMYSFKFFFASTAGVLVLGLIDGLGILVRQHR